MLIENEKLKESSIDVNVSQRPREEEPIEKVVCTWMVWSMWDRHVSPNPHIFSIYLQLILALGTKLERFDEC